MIFFGLLLFYSIIGVLTTVFAKDVFEMSNSESIRRGLFGC